MCSELVSALRPWQGQGHRQQLRHLPFYAQCGFSEHCTERCPRFWDDGQVSPEPERAADLLDWRRHHSDLIRQAS